MSTIITPILKKRTLRHRISWDASPLCVKCTRLYNTVTFLRKPSMMSLGGKKAFISVSGPYLGCHDLSFLIVDRFLTVD